MNLSDLLDRLDRADPDDIIGFSRDGIEVFYHDCGLLKTTIELPRFEEVKPTNALKFRKAIKNFARDVELPSHAQVSITDEFLYFETKEDIFQVPLNQFGGTL